MIDDKKRESPQENELERNITELKEWQDNQFNPGYHIGSGRVRRPISSLGRYPIIFLLFGITGLFISVFTFIQPVIMVSNIPSFILGLFISSCLIYGGVVRIISKRKEGWRKEHKP